MGPGEKLAGYLVNAGPHPLFGGWPWWQIAFDFGDVQVSIAETPDTQGVEVMVIGMWEKPMMYATPEMAVEVLDLFVELLEAKKQQMNEVNHE